MFWFEWSSGFGSVVLRRTVAGVDWRFDNLSGSHLLWWWLPLSRLSKRQSTPTTVLLRTTLQTRTITQTKTLTHLGSNLSLLYCILRPNTRVIATPSLYALYQYIFEKKMFFFQAGANRFKVFFALNIFLVFSKLLNSVSECVQELFPTSVHRSSGQDSSKPYII